MGAGPSRCRRARRSRTESIGGRVAHLNSDRSLMCHRDPPQKTGVAGPDEATGERQLTCPQPGRWVVSARGECGGYSDRDQQARCDPTHRGLRRAGSRSPATRRCSTVGTAPKRCAPSARRYSSSRAAATAAATPAINMLSRSRWEGSDLGVGKLSIGSASDGLVRSPRSCDESRAPDALFTEANVGRATGNSSTLAGLWTTCCAIGDVGLGGTRSRRASIVGVARAILRRQCGLGEMNGMASGAWYARRGRAARHRFPPALGGDRADWGNRLGAAVYLRRAG